MGRSVMPRLGCGLANRLGQGHQGLNPALRAGCQQITKRHSERLLHHCFSTLTT